VQKADEPIEKPFRILSCMSTSNYVLDGVQVFPRQGAL